jgi:hypothetical protein
MVQWWCWPGPVGNPPNCYKDKPETTGYKDKPETTGYKDKLETTGYK